MSAKAILACVLLVAACATPGTPRAWRAIDLDRPGALETLQRDNPAHYAKVEKLLDEAARRPVQSLPGWMEAELGARDVEGLVFGMPGRGPQARVTFALDGRQYTKLVPLR